MSDGQRRFEVLALPGESSSAGEARRWLHRVLIDWGSEAFDDVVALVASELVANAALHAKTRIELRVIRLADGLRLEVSDASSRLPQRRHYGLEATTGRGLGLVAVLSRSWGAEPTATGKVVWCEIAEAEPARSHRDADEISVDLDGFADLFDLPSDSQGALPGPECFSATHRVAA